MSRNNMNMPWTEKYRPKTLDEIIDHKSKIDTLKSLIKSNELTHLLFYGAPGSGKTSMIHACAYEIYGENYKSFVLELNASNERGIDTVRETIPNFLKIYSTKMKLVILDEADAMTNDAQCALKRMIELYSKVSRFCIICNNISKINPGIRSRCMELKFTNLNVSQIVSKLEQIIKLENINITPQAIYSLVNINSDFRQILNILQCLHSASVYSNEVITNNTIYMYLGYPTEKDILECIRILNIPSFKESANLFYDLYLNHKWDLHDILLLLNKYILNTSSISNDNMIKIITKLSDIEYKIVNLHDLEIQIYSLVAEWHNIFKE